MRKAIDNNQCADKLILETILQDKFFISRRRKEAQRWLRRPTTTQQMKNQASLESVTYLFDVLEFGCIRKRRLDKLYKELEGEQSRKRGDDWYMRSNKMRIKQTNSEVLLLFAIVEFLAWGMWFYTKESIGIIMGVSFIIIMLPSALITLKSVILTEDGCEVIALFRKKSYKWNELEIIRKDCWSSGGQYATRVDGIVFSEKKRGKKGKVYSSYELYSNYVRSSRLDCFCIVFCDKSAKIKYIIKNHLDRSDVFKKPSEKILEQLSEWGVEVEEGENLRKERKQKGKQKVYDEIVRIRKEHKKNN